MPKYDHLKRIGVSYTGADVYSIEKGYGRNRILRSAVGISVGPSHIEVSHFHHTGRFGLVDILSCMGQPDHVSSRDKFIKIRWHRDQRPPYGETIRHHADRIDRVWYITPSLLERLQTNDSQMAKMLLDLLIDRVNVVDLLGD